MRHFAISAANFSISTLVLQKQHRLKHKRQFSQLNKHKIRSKSFYTQILCYDMFEMQKKRQSWHAGNITDWMIDLYNEYYECLYHIRAIAYHLADRRAGGWANSQNSRESTITRLFRSTYTLSPLRPLIHKENSKLQQFQVIQGHPFPCKWDANNGLRIRI